MNQELILNNQILLTTLQTVMIVVGAILVIAIIALIIVLVKKSKKTKITRVKIDDNFLNTLYKGLGGKANILEVEIDNGRLKFKIDNLKKLDKTALDEISQSGVFITGKHVKLLFKYDAKDIKNAMESA